MKRGNVTIITDYWVAIEKSIFLIVNAMYKITELCENLKGELDDI